MRAWTGAALCPCFIGHELVTGKHHEMDNSSFKAWLNALMPAKLFRANVHKHCYSHPKQSIQHCPIPLYYLNARRTIVQHNFWWTCAYA